jgi:hypothetical protein
MELHGKYLVTWLTTESARAALGLYEGIEGHWLLMGRIEGETPALGLWITLEETLDAEGQRIELPEANKDAATLIRWEWMIGAVLWRSRPASHPVGFKLGDRRP